MAEYRCSACKKEYESSKGVKCCRSCQEYLFTPCLENMDGFPPRPPQKIQRRSETGGSVWSCSGNLPVMPAEIRDMQDSLSTNLHCKMHSRPALPFSFNTGHNDIEEVVQTKPAQIVNENPEGKRQTTLKDGQVGQHHFEDECKKLRESCLREIQKFRTDINQIIDQMELVSVAELENVFRELDTVLRDKRNALLKDLSKTIDEKKQIQEHLPKQVMSETFCKGDSINAEKSLFGYADITSAGPVFVKNTKLLEILKKFSSLGAIHFPQKQGLHHIRSEKTVNVAHANDKEVCSIHSACFTSSNDVLLADYKNKNIKRLDCTDCMIKDVLPLKHYPLSVCDVSDVEAAAGLAETLYVGGSNTIQFLSTKDKLVPTRSVKLDHCCAGICVVGSNIFVSNQRKRLYKYNLEGVLQKTVHMDQTGNEIFSKSYSITKSDDGKMVYVTDLNKGLVTLDRGGNGIWKFSGPELKMAWGVCTDGEGNCFVAGGNSGNVIQIGPSGNYVGEVVSASHGIKDPQAVCFNKKTSRLVVSRYNCNSVHIFSLQ